jgi:methylenetetrahydrofolate reductase (NADPH)
LRGDAIKTENYFTPDSEGHSYANELVQQISDLNQGTYLDEELLNSHKTDFCIGVSGYPEKHMEAPSLENDLHFLKKKIKAGADYIVTQMFFDNQKFFEFVEKAREEGITAPIIPGLKPLTTLKQLNMIPHRFHVDLPEALIKEVIKCKDNNAIHQVGVEWCTEQSKELMAAEVPFLHYYTMGKSDNIKQIAEAVF